MDVVCRTIYNGCRVWDNIQWLCVGQYTMEVVCRTIYNGGCV